MAGTKTAPKKRAEGRRQRTPEAIAAGGETMKQASVVKRYLEALEVAAPKRGRQPRPPQERLDAVNEKLRKCDRVLEKLTLLSERERIMHEINTPALDDNLEVEFTVVAKAYGEKKGIGYSTWRAVGVPASVLKAAGISR